MRDTAGSVAAPAARCRNLRRGSFILHLPLASPTGLCVRIVRVSRIDETGPAHAQYFFHLLNRFVDHATRLPRLKLVLQFNEGSIGTVEATRQNLRNVKERDRVSRE